MKKEFVSKQDLGVAYFPDADLRYARQKLCEIIHDDHKLMARLAKTGYRKKSKYLSPIQLELIFERLGKPFWAMSGDFSEFFREFLGSVILYNTEIYATFLIQRGNYIY